MFNSSARIVQCYSHCDRSNTARGQAAYVGRRTVARTYVRGCEIVPLDVVIKQCVSNDGSGRARRVTPTENASLTKRSTVVLRAGCPIFGASFVPRTDWTTVARDSLRVAG